MTMKTSDAGADVAVLEENLEKIDALTRRLTKALMRKSPPNPRISTADAGVFTKAATNYWTEMVQNPSKLIEQQVEYWGKSLRHFVEAQHVLAQGRLEAPEDPTPEDMRFKNPLWKSNPYFNFIKQQYLINSEAVEKAVEGMEDIDETERRSLRYFSQQIINMMAPTNFLGTNPDALEKAMETEGASLVQGLENLVADLEANNGELVVRLADDKAFEVGRNIATTPGKVVLRNKMIELIQYSPTTEQVHQVPIVLFPPWINKFYILDLKEKNSLIKWIVDQGYTLFVVSWVNPDAEFADVGMEDYITDGYLAAIETAKAITKQKEVNAIGYCIAGTTLHLVLALLKKRGDKSVKSATFFTTLTDFSDQGEFTPFLQPDFIEGVASEVEQVGVLRAFLMGRTMSFLRSNDLVYQPAIRNYMMGETPPAFDLLYWNGDGSGLPGKMVMQYLQDLCSGNQFIEGTFELMGETLSIKDVTVPLCSIATETDHIAPWKDCYRGFGQTGSRSKTFIVGQSGHIAGIVNPPNKKKYGHYVNDDTKLAADEWLEGATFHEGSWWPRWESWIKKKSGKLVEARQPGDSDHEAICDAPGTYVLAKALV